VLMYCYVFEFDTSQCYYGSNQDMKLTSSQCDFYRAAWNAAR